MPAEQALADADRPLSFGVVAGEHRMAYRVRMSASKLPTAQQALPGRAQAIAAPAAHFVLGAPMVPPWPEGMGAAMFGMGCFWGAERKFWVLPGVHSTAVGYAGGRTPNPTYREVCSGATGHNEVVRVIFDRAETDYGALLKIFWESHDPTQGMRQGNDVGTQYRSGIYCATAADKSAAEASRDAFAGRLREATFGEITTEIVCAPTFFYAEEYHQQYLGKNPSGYCGLGGTGVTCPVGLGAPAN